MLKKIVSILIISVVALLSGCWDSRNIEDLDICTSVLLDFREGEYEFYAEIIDITAGKNAQDSGDGGMKTTIVRGSGEDFAKARMDFDSEVNKPIYIGAVQTLIITEDMADKGIEEYAYRIREMNEYRKTLNIVITPDEPEELLGQQPANSANVGFAIDDTLHNLLDQGATFHLSLADVLQKLCARNKSYLLCTLGVKKEEIALLGYTVFEGGQRKGFIPYEQSRGVLYAILGGKKMTPTFHYVVNSENSAYTLEVKLKSRSVKAKWDGARAAFDVDMDFTAKMLYQSANIPVTPEIKQQIKAELANQLMEEVTQAIRTSVDYECDYLYFSEPFRTKFPGIYEQIDWRDTFINADFTVNLTISFKEHEAYDYSR